MEVAARHGDPCGGVVVLVQQLAADPAWNHGGVSAVPQWYGGQTGHASDVMVVWLAMLGYSLAPGGPACGSNVLDIVIVVLDGARRRDPRNVCAGTGDRRDDRGPRMSPTSGCGGDWRQWQKPLTSLKASIESFLLACTWLYIKTGLLFI